MSVAVQAAALPVAHAANGPLLNMQSALDIGQKNSPELQDLAATLDQKKIELQQAQKVKRAKPNSLAKNIDVQMKVPTARSALSRTEREIKLKTLSVRLDIEKMYMNAYLAEVAYDNAVRMQADTRKMRDDVRAKNRFGLATDDQVKAAEEAMEKADSEVKMAELAFKGSRLDLGGKTGLDLEADYRFDIRKKWAPLDQGVLFLLLDRAEQTDLDLYKAVEDRKLAQGKVNATHQIFQRKFGWGTARMVAGMYTKPDGSTDYPAFMRDYEAMLQNVKEKWEWFFFFPAPWIIILPIPKPWLQGEYDGLRFFEDIRYSLPVSMMDLDKAKLKEADTRKNVINKIKKSYLDAKQTEEAYIQTLKARDVAREQLRAAESKVKFGTITEEELLKVREAYIKKEQTVLSSFVAYQSMLSQLDAFSGGAISQRYRPGEIPPPYNVDSGLGPMKPPAAAAVKPLGKWKLKERAESLSSEFSVEPAGVPGVTHFQLVTKDGQPIGAATPVKEKVIHLNLVFADLQQVKVILLNGSTKLAEAELEGMGEGLLLPAQKEGATP